MIEHELAPCQPAKPTITEEIAESASPCGRTDTGSISRKPQLAPAMATSVIAATAWDQLASSIRMPRTSSSSPVPTMLAATPVQNAAPADQMPVRSQNASPVHQ